MRAFHFQADPNVTEPTQLEELGIMQGNTYLPGMLNRVIWTLRDQRRLEIYTAVYSTRQENSSISAPSARSQPQGKGCDHRQTCPDKTRPSSRSIEQKKPTFFPWGPQAIIIIDRAENRGNADYGLGN